MNWVAEDRASWEARKCHHWAVMDGYSALIDFQRLPSSLFKTTGPHQTSNFLKAVKWTGVCHVTSLCPGNALVATKKKQSTKLTTSFWNKHLIWALMHFFPDIDQTPLVTLCVPDTALGDEKTADWHVACPQAPGSRVCKRKWAGSNFLNKYQQSCRRHVGG